MEVTSKMSQRIILFALVSLIVPMLTFPHRFGTELARGSIMTALYEMVAYAIVVMIIQRRGGLIQLVQAAGMCLIYRLAVGALFGVLIAAMYAMDISISVTLGVASYLPGILFQAAMAPLVLWPIISQLYRDLDRATRSTEEPLQSTAPRMEQGMTSIAVSKDRGYTPRTSAKSQMVGQTSPAVSMSPTSGPEAKISADTGGFDRAVLYLGEHGSVQLAAVVDAEGLQMSSYHRGDIVPEDWTPMARVLLEANNELLSKCNLTGPEKLDMVVEDKRLTLVCCGKFDLMVLAELQSDDVLGIRINQAVDIVNKYAEQRYSRLFQLIAENKHVPSLK